MAYDRNGLELTSVSNTLNAYRLTAVDKTKQKINAYANSHTEYKDQFHMHTIGQYDDARDAAYVGQQFEKKYDKYVVRQLVKDGLFSEIAKEFRQNIEIPEWIYPAEGLDWDDILGGKYETNYVDNARDAIREALKILNKKAPPIEEAKKIIAKVEQLFKDGMTYRQAAHKVINV